MKKIARAIRTGFAKSKEEPSGGEAGAETGASPSEDGADAAKGAKPQAPQAAPAERAADISKLAHELKTPLSAIVLAAEIMKDERFGALANERYRNYTTDIHDNARHALALINRLLGGDAEEPSANDLQTADLDLNALAEGSVSAVRPLADEAGLKLTHEFHGRLPHVRADATTIKQILFNLLSNAIKFTPRGGDVRVVTGLGFDRSVFIAVQDTGAGMSEATIAALLKAEVPANPQPTSAGGHGIGLPLARSLAEANGARLEIDSALSEGTAVALVFPRDRVVPSSLVSN
jgi:signal transduction histidine kinase